MADREYILREIEREERRLATHLEAGDAESAERSQRWLASIREYLAFDAATVDVSKVAINSLRRHVSYYKLGDSMNADFLAAFVRARSDAELLEFRNIGKRGLAALRVWAGEREP